MVDAPTTAETHPVETIHDILANTTAWTLAAPEVELQWNVTQQDREHNPNPCIYVWSPVEGSADAFDAEYSELDRSQTVECQIWTLDADETAQYKEDVKSILSQYGNDNESKTAFHRIRPTSTADMRNEHMARRTDHYIGMVQVTMQKLDATGV